MSEKTQRPHAQTAEDKQAKHYAADWWIYLVLALFIVGRRPPRSTLIPCTAPFRSIGEPDKLAAPPASAAPTQYFQNRKGSRRS